MFAEYEHAQGISCQILKKAVINRQFSHAYLFETNGYDKGYNMAVDFAKQILCSNNGNCDNCSQCQMIDENNFPELRIIDDDDIWIKKEKLLSLQNEFNKKPVIGEYKVYIINHAEKLNVSSSNSILKFLEEPAPGIIAILVTNNRYKLLETIISRCQIISLNGRVEFDYDIKNATINRIGQVLTNNKEAYNKFCSEESNLEKIQAIVKFCSYYENNGINIILYIHKYWHKYFTDKLSVGFGLTCLLYFYRDMLNLKLNREVEIFIDYIPELRNLAGLNSLEKLVKKIDIINESINNLDYNANLNLLIDKLIIRMEGEK